jgi:beta-lactamase class A
MANRLSRDDVDRGIAAIQDRFSGVLGLAAKNLATGEEILVDPDRSFPTASAFKVPVMTEVFRQAEEGRFKFDDRRPVRAEDIVKGSGVLRALQPGIAPTIHDLATLMIIVSDNTATNMLIDLVGGVEPINQTMRDRLGLSAIVVHNRIEFDLIEKDNRSLAEATPRDLMHLCELLAREELISVAASRAMLAIMRQQHYLNQFPRYLNYNPYGPELNVPQKLWIANKTGGLPGMRSDTGVIGLPTDVLIAFGVMTEHSSDTGFTFENEAEIANGAIGRLLIEYWWPGNWEADQVGRPSPYLATAAISA